MMKTRTLQEFIAIVHVAVSWLVLNGYWFVKHHGKYSGMMGSTLALLGLKCENQIHFLQSMLFECLQSN